MGVSGRGVSYRGVGGISCLPPHHLQPPDRKPSPTPLPPGGRGGDQPSRFPGGRKGQDVPATGCAVRAPSPAARDFPGPARFSGELLPRERTELPQEGWGSRPPTDVPLGCYGSGLHVGGAKVSHVSQERTRWPWRRARLDSAGSTLGEAGSGERGGWRRQEGSRRRVFRDRPALHRTLLLPP